MTLRSLYKALPLLVFGGLVALAITACGGQSGSNNPVAQAQPAAGAQSLTYQIVGADNGLVGPDGAKHDAFTATGPTTVQAGVPVTITITNKDDGQHTFTLPDLGINIVVPGAKGGKDGVATYTFTPTKAGNFRWYCAIPCDTDNNGWDMTQGENGPDQTGFMAGSITVE